MNKVVSFAVFMLLAGACAGFAPVVSANDEMGCIRGDCENGTGTLVHMTELGLATYRGAFREGNYHGYGRLVLHERGENYKGNFLNGRKHGRGILWDDNNNVYIGQWRNDRRNGQGTQAFNVDGWYEDRNTERWLAENTENYTGEFRNDVFAGQGTYRWANGTRYVGGWMANKKHGRGYFDFGNNIRSPRVFDMDVQIE